jgi:hypothetical protein
VGLGVVHKLRYLVFRMLIFGFLDPLAPRHGIFTVLSIEIDSLSCSAHLLPPLASITLFVDCRLFNTVGFKTFFPLGLLINDVFEGGFGGKKLVKQGLGRRGPNHMEF